MADFLNKEILIDIIKFYLSDAIPNLKSEIIEIPITNEYLSSDVNRISFSFRLITEVLLAAFLKSA